VTQTIERPVRRRRRGTAVEKAISDAVLAELAEVGFGRLTFEGVAERAGTGKSPLYRRWPDTVSLVIDTLEKLGADPAGYRRTGVLRDDVIGLTVHMTKTLSGVKGEAFRSLLGEAHRYPPLLARFMSQVLDPLFETLTDLLHEVELPLVRILREMELEGCKLDTDRLREISARVKAEADQLEREIFEMTGEEFTLGSPKQLEEVLFGRLGLSRKRRGKTGYSTDARVLQAIRHEHPVIPKIERWRELTKLAQTYLDALPLLIDSSGRIHTTFNQTAATTGRLSSNNPNLQNIPIRTPLGREIRACFVAEAGDLLVSADYSQVELRLLAHIAGEDALKEIFRKGEDVHTATACRVFGVTPEQIDPGMRSKSKMINYGIVYGLSAWGMADRLDIPQEEAEEFIQRYMSGFPAVARWIEETIEQGTEHGYVSTLFGRRRQVPELRARRWELRKQGERFAVNMVIQGTAADIIKVAMVRCEQALEREGLKSRMILQIHDELLFEGPADEAEQVKQIAIEQMSGAFEMDPPLAVDAGIGTDWLNAK